MKDAEVLEALSNAEEAPVSALAVTYPTSLSHIDEANAAIAKIDISKPTAWLTTFTGFVTSHVFQQLC